MENFEVELVRPNKSITWGFSIQGGKDFGCPLSVLRVTPNSISDKLGMRVNDLLIKINDLPTETLTHQQAILQIQNLNVILELRRLPRLDSELPPPPPPVEIEIFNKGCRISSSISEMPPPPPEIGNSNVYSNSTNINYFPPPNSNTLISQNKSPIMTTQNYEPNKFDQNNSRSSFGTKIEKSPEIILKSENIELLLKSKNNEKKNPEPVVSSSLGKFLQNQETRDNRDLVITKSSADSNLAICFVCKDQIKGSYIEANNKIYCSNHFCCSFCKKPIKGTQFIETKEGTLYCMEDFRDNVASRCSQCSQPIIEQQIMALGKCWHPSCFLCNHCGKSIPQGQFHIKEENNQTFIYCEKDYKIFYEVKCFGCKLAIDSDDKYLQVGTNNYHVECFKR